MRNKLFLPIISAFVGIIINIILAFSRQYKNLFLTLNVNFIFFCLLLFLLKYDKKMKNVRFGLYGFLLFQLVGLAINSGAWVQLLVESIIVVGVFVCFHFAEHKARRFLSIFFFYFSLPIIAFIIVPNFYYNKKKSTNLKNVAFFKNSEFNNLKILKTNGALGSAEGIKNKILLIDFWFKGCMPCKQKESALNKIAEYFRKDTSFVILAINPGSINTLEEFKSYSFGHPKIISAYDSAGLITNAYKIVNFPTSFLINSMGNIQYKEEGFTANSEAFYVHKTIKEIEKCLIQK